MEQQYFKPPSGHVTILSILDFSTFLQTNCHPTPPWKFSYFLVQERRCCTTWDGLSLVMHGIFIHQVVQKFVLIKWYMFHDMTWSEFKWNVKCFPGRSHILEDVPTEQGQIWFALEDKKLRPWLRLPSSPCYMPTMDFCETRVLDFVVRMSLADLNLSEKHIQVWLYQVA